jgi:hypothetical protein
MRNSLVRGLIQKFILFLAPLVTLSEAGDCQSLKVPEYSIEAGGIGSIGRQTPFWLVCNQSGKNSNRLTSGFVSAKIHSGIDTGKAISFGYGLELLDRQDGNNNFRIQQANVKLKYRFIYLRIGSEEDPYGNQDSTLSSGSMLWSENTRPMPKIVISTNGYTDVPFTKGYVQFSGLLAHGWFGDDGYVKDVYLHHKYVYIKAGGNLPVNISMGLQHYAMWGGVSTDTAIGKLPADLNAYTKVFFAKHSHDNNPDIPLNEALNKLGNHLGSWNYGIDIKLDNYLLGLYYQTIFEDYSGYSKFFMRDGLWGFSVKTKNARKLIHAFTYEYIHTSYQSGPPAAISTQFTRGNDNYFNNSIYRSGWTYNNYTIGTPLISSPAIIKGESIYLTNNRVIAHQIGIQGELNEFLNYRMLITTSNNYGTYSMPFPKTEPVQSVFLELNKSVQRFHGVEIAAQIAADHGRLYGNNAGILLKIRKSGRFSRKPISADKIF